MRWRHWLWHLRPKLLAEPVSVAALILAALNGAFTGAEAGIVLRDKYDKYALAADLRALPERWRASIAERQAQNQTDPSTGITRYRVALESRLASELAERCEEVAQEIESAPGSPLIEFVEGEVAEAIASTALGMGGAQLVPGAGQLVSGGELVVDEVVEGLSEAAINTATVPETGASAQLINWEERRNRLQEEVGLFLGRPLALGE